VSWRDSMVPASFRGVEFLVESDERSGGRAGEAHVTPGSNDPPYVEDTGIKGRSFRLDGFLVGADCLEARNRLLDALELEGSGDLQHPTYGVRRVSVADFSVRYSSKQGGLVTLSMTFLETTAEPRWVLDVLSPVGTVAAAASTFADTSLALFLEQYVTVPYSAEMQAQLSNLSHTVNQIASTKALADDAAASLEQQSFQLAHDSAALLASPGTLATALRGIVASLASGLRYAASGLDPLAALLQLFDEDPGERPQDSTPEGEIAATSFDAMASMTKREVLGSAAGICAGQAHESYEDAVGARASVTSRIDQYCETTQDESYDSMTGLRRALAQAVPGPDADLPHVESVSVPASVPSLVLSYTLYGDLNHEEGILARNKVADPTYLPGGVALEVLSK
jgi:prophage DNA circulation protein